jgi:hypothetical protein
MDDRCCLKAMLCGEDESPEIATVTGELPGRTITDLGSFPAHGTAYVGEQLTVQLGRLQVARRGPPSVEIDAPGRNGPLLLGGTDNSRSPIPLPIGGLYGADAGSGTRPAVAGWFYDAGKFHTVTYESGVARLYVHSLETGVGTLLATLATPAGFRVPDQVAGTQASGTFRLWRQMDTSDGLTRRFDYTPVTAAGFGATTVAETRDTGTIIPNNRMATLMGVPAALPSDEALFSLHSIGADQFTATTFKSGFTRLTMTNSPLIAMSTRYTGTPVRRSTPALTDRYKIAGFGVVGVEAGAAWIQGTLPSGLHEIMALRPKTLSNWAIYADSNSYLTPPAPILTRGQLLSATVNGISVPSYVATQKIKTGVQLTPQNQNTSFTGNVQVTPPGVAGVVWAAIRIGEKDATPPVGAGVTYVAGPGFTGGAALTVAADWNGIVPIRFTAPTQVFAASVWFIPA